MAETDAAVETTEQTTDTAAVQTDAATSTTETSTQATDQAAASTEAAQPQLFAGKFKTAEEAYWHSQGELNALRTAKPSAQTQTAQPAKYTPDQLWGLRSKALQDMTAAQVAGNAEQAGTLAANINWIDNEIQQQNMSKLRGEITGQSAVQSLNNESAELLKPYQADLVPGNPLYEQAQSYFGMMKQAMEGGVPLDNILSGLAVLAAAAKTGKTTAGTAQEARAEFAGSLNKALKQAVVTGAGKAAKVPDGAPDFASMTNKQFDDYRRKIGVLS